MFYSSDWFNWLDSLDGLPFLTNKTNETNETFPYISKTTSFLSRLI
jgi:hypothetical protein